MSKIITTTELAEYLGLTLDEPRTALIVNAVNQYVESLTNRCFGETKTVTEEYDFGKTLWLRHQDVTAITSIQAGFTGQTLQTIDATGYRFNKQGRVTMFWTGGAGSGSSYYNDYLHVQYTYGQVDVPDDLKEAALGVAAGYYNWAKAGGKEIVSSSVGSYRIETAGAIRGSSSTTPTPWMNAAEAHFMTIKGYATQRV